MPVLLICLEQLQNHQRLQNHQQQHQQRQQHQVVAYLQLQTLLVEPNQELLLHQHQPDQTCLEDLNLLMEQELEQQLLQHLLEA